MVYVFLAEGFEEIEVVEPIDIMRRAGIEVVTVSLGDKVVTGSHGIGIEADMLIKDISINSAQAIMLPGGMPGTENLFANSNVKGIILQAADKGIYIAAICAAPIILGRLGLLEGKRAICYPGFEDQLTGALITDQRVVVDKNIVTSKGAGCSAEFGFALVSLLKDEKTSKELYCKMQYLVR